MNTPHRKPSTYRLTAITAANLELLSKLFDTNKTAIVEMAIIQLAERHETMPTVGEIAM